MLAAKRDTSQQLHLHLSRCLPREVSISESVSHLLSFSIIYTNSWDQCDVALPVSAMDSNPSSPLFQRSWIALFNTFLKNPSKTHKPASKLLSIFFSFLIFLCNFSFVNSDPAFESSYVHLCNHIVPISVVRPNSPSVSVIAQSLQFRSQFGYFSGGDRLFNQIPRSRFNYIKAAAFRVQSVRNTVNDDIYEVRARLHLRHRPIRTLQSNFRNLRGIVYRSPRVSLWGAAVGLTLYGFWSESAGKFCMVGSDYYGNVRKTNVILQLNYPKISSIFNSLINGILESFDDPKSLNFFEPISILAISQSSNYQYTLVKEGNGIACSGGYDSGESLPLHSLAQGVCGMLYAHNEIFELEYGSGCDGVNCNPLGVDFGYLPKSMYYYGARCDEGRKVQMLLVFPNSSYNGVLFPFYPNTTLISEGIWDEKENQFCAVACRILNFAESPTNVSIGDCSIRLTLRFPAFLSLRNRSTIEGRIWSNKDVDQSVRISKIGLLGPGSSTGLQIFKYKYTEMNRVRKFCSDKRTAIGQGKMYPNGYSTDMRFDMSVKNGKGHVAQGYASPQFVDHHVAGLQEAVQLINNGTLLNMSYTLSFKPSADFKFDGDIASNNKEVEISAEGMYDRNTGVLCMMGCRHLGSRLKKNEYLDCDIVVNVQFPPVNEQESESIKGTIESTRETSDPLYFKALQLFSNSIYTKQAKESIWRMDFEIIMVLISNTLSCMFVALQLFYVKKYPEVLPPISIVMLVLLTLGHMIPLLLNFEALFMSKHTQQNVFLESGGWLEVNEVIVRIVTMVSFLLQTRLLQLTYSSRRGEESQQRLWISERKVVYVTLPLYVSGGLTAWFVHRWKSSYQGPLRLSRHRFARGRPSFRPPSLWEDLKSYAGLLLDGFLLPQILFNMFLNSEEHALTFPFYFGTTIVRILPHAYDLYRAHSSAWFLDLSYIYANHRMDFYSTAWDIIIPCAGLLFSALVFFQQRFGGLSILPKRFRESYDYEKVPVIGNQDL
ncbi:hypothetical protein L6164_032845 [Bauhinia variegata]|uniref:Uncharacterized protein n=1 Tax=Bauhinia variegata TaxID=167791 RepID=A0ACB9KQ22_BAUVA|nr:hypothetical protein L6164_032845 [Bauhinia variegata]